MGYAETLRRMQQHYRVIDDENQPLLQTNEWATMGFHCATGYLWYTSKKMEVKCGTLHRCGTIL